MSERELHEGLKLGRVTLLKRERPNVWKCRCDCGNEVILHDSVLKSTKHGRSCGKCGYKSKLTNETIGAKLEGKKFGRLTAIKPTEKRQCGKVIWLCRCDCGRIAYVTAGHLGSGSIRSCGKCGYRDEALRDKSLSVKTPKDRLYRILSGMIDRCHNARSTSYKDYGARGITVCDEWRNNRKSFVDWALSNGYDKELSIDRIDNDKGYSPENCRWITRAAQQMNKRSNHCVEVDGESKTITEWADFIGVNRNDLYFMSSSVGDDAVIKKIESVIHAPTEPNIAEGVTMSDYNYQFDKEVVCISHVDLDGYCAAAVVKQRYPDARIFYSNYGKSTPTNAFIPRSKLIVTDFSLPEHEFDKCKRLGIEVVLLDHHEFKYKELEAHGYSFPGLRNPEMSGSELAWRFLFPSSPVPRVIRIVTSYDLWKFNEPKTKEFAAGIQMFEQRAAYKSCYIWGKLLSPYQDIAESTLENVIKIGERIVNYEQTHNALICKDVSYRATLPTGQKCLVAAIKGANSSFFDSVDKTDIDALCMSQYATDIQKYRCSVYAPDKTKVVLPIAQAFGGGGHPGAAGFQTCDYPFPMPQVTTPRPMSEVITELRKILEMRSDLLVNQYASRGDKINLSSRTFKTRFNHADKLCIAINHPYVSELIRIFPGVVDLIDNDILGEIATSIVGYTLTNSGWYRCGFYLLDQGSDSGKSFNAETFRNSLPKLDPNGRVDSVYEEDLGSLGKVMWWYSTDIPVIVPIDRITRK